MFSDRANLVREKQFPRQDPTKGHHLAVTLTDDHTLFLLNQQRERQAKIDRGSWWSRLFRSRR